MPKNKKVENDDKSAVDPNDAFCNACIGNRKRLQKLLKSPKTDPREIPLLEQRIANMTTAIKIYKQRKALG